MHLDTYSVIDVIGVYLHDILSLRYLQGIDVAHILNIVSRELVDTWHRVVLRHSRRHESKLADIVARVADPKQKHSFGDSLERLHISDVNVRLGGALINGEPEDAFVKLVLIVKEVENSPSEAHKLVKGCCVGLWDLDFEN